MKTNYWFNRNPFLSQLRIATAGRRPPVRRGFVLTALALALACFALSPQARAVCQQGCDISNQNTFLGDNALLHNTSGFDNTAIGAGALLNNTSGILNTAIGVAALYSNTDGWDNTANGVGALESNTTGLDNTANGFGALDSNTIGNNNTANGSNVLGSNTTGNSNTANGYQALFGNTTGFQNVANGVMALISNTIGYRNTADGTEALYSNTTGANNTAEGFQALYHNIGSNNIGLGRAAGFNLTTGSGNVCIGSGVLGVAGESNTTRIRNVYTSVASVRAVYVNSDNKIGTLVSSRRFKEEIKPMDSTSEAILALKPVTFRYKKEIEPHGAIMFGLIAEEVEKVDPDLVTRNDKGEVETVRYEAVNAMLLNEFLKEHRTVAALKTTVAKQEATNAQLQQQIKALNAGLKEQASQIQKVTAQLAAASPSHGGLEARNVAPQMVLNNQ